mmetsp:Transcript_94564/g.282401  ORF Transcript_94564/g.282401 Transcript_94564/m.282401 type:complete len:272 (+) Transcript_94564:985-1800(+)
MPESLKAWAVGAVRSPPTCTVAPKPRGVRAATALPVPSSAGPHASICGSKKPGHETAAVPVAVPALPGARARTEIRPSRPEGSPAPGRRALPPPAPPGAESRRPPSVSVSACLFSSCQAICSGIQGRDPACQGKPMGVPSSCGSSDSRVMGGRDQCGAVTRACSPSTTSTMQQAMRKAQETQSAMTMDVVSFQGSMCCVCANTEWAFLPACRVGSPFVSGCAPAWPAAVLPPHGEAPPPDPARGGRGLVPSLTSRTMSCWPGCRRDGGATR